MQLSRKQAKKVRNKLKKLSLPEVAAQLGIGQTELIDFCREEHIRVNPRPESSFSLKSWLNSNRTIALLLAALVAITYSYTLNYPFVSDDVTAIAKANLSDFSLVTSNPWAFVRNLIYFLTNALFGKLPIMFRLANLLSHLTVVLAVYSIIDLLVSRRAAIFSACLIAVHPIMVESIVWISGGAYSSYTAFCLVSLFFFILRRRYPSFIWISLVSFLIALEFSEKAVVLPALLCTYLLLYENIRKSWKTLIPYILMSCVWILVFAGFLTARQTQLQQNFFVSSRTISPFSRIPMSVGSYIILLLWPDQLTLYHSDFNFTPIGSSMVAVLTVLYFAFCIFFWYRGTRSDTWLKHPAFWLPVLIISLSPVIASGNLAWIVAERYAYFGSAAFLITLGISIEHIGKKVHRDKGAVVLVGIVSIALLARTVIRNFDWRDQDHLWIATARTSPSSAQNNNNLGEMYAKRGDPDKALMHFTRATELESCYGDAYHNLATTYFYLNKLDDAVKNYNKSIDCKPSLWQSHSHLAAIYYKAGEKEKALNEIKAAIKLNPSDPALKQDLDLIGAGQLK